VVLGGDFHAGPNHDKGGTSIMARVRVLPLTCRTKKGNTSERICDDNLRSNRSHWRGIMSAPTSSGGLGDGGLGRGRTLVRRERRRFYNNAGVLIV
jgi:hypothetical protein